MHGGALIWAKYVHHLLTILNPELQSSPSSLLRSLAGSQVPGFAQRLCRRGRSRMSFWVSGSHSRILLLLIFQPPMFAISFFSVLCLAAGCDSSEWCLNRSGLVRRAVLECIGVFQAEIVLKINQLFRFLFDLKRLVYVKYIIKLWISGFAIDCADRPLPVSTVSNICFTWNQEGYIDTSLGWYKCLPSDFGPTF